MLQCRRPLSADHVEMAGQPARAGGPANPRYDGPEVMCLPLTLCVPATEDAVAADYALGYAQARAEGLVAGVRSLLADTVTQVAESTEIRCPCPAGTLLLYILMKQASWLFYDNHRVASPCQRRWLPFDLPFTVMACYPHRQCGLAQPPIFELHMQDFQDRKSRQAVFPLQYNGVQFLSRSWRGCHCHARSPAA